MRRPRVTLLELCMGLGALACYPLAGPAASGLAMAGALGLSYGIRRSRQPILDNSPRIGRFRLGARNFKGYQAWDETGREVRLALHGPYNGGLRDALKHWSELRHPLFLPLLDWGVYDGEAYTVHAPALDAFIGPLARERLLDFARPLLEGVAEAGLRCGDLRLSRLTQVGWTPRLDFEWSPRPQATACQKLEFGVCSPEELAGRPRDLKSLQFHLGSLLLEALTGVEPVVFAEPHPVGEPALDAWLGRLMARDPAERFPDLSDALVDLARLAC